MNKNILTLASVSLFALGQVSGSAAWGEVTLYGSTWTGKVDGVTKYTGSSMSAAANACINAMSSGTVAIRNSGDKAGRITISKSNITVDGTGRTISGGGTTGLLYAENKSNVNGRNIVMASSDWYGMYFRTCNGVNTTGTSGTANLGWRIDNCKGGAGYNLTVGSPTSSTSGSYGSHFVETYGIGTVNWGTITANTRSTGCGLLLNTSSTCNGTAVNGTRNNYGGGYAAFRTANNNRSTTVGTVNATSCGRGYFSVSGSQGCTVSTLNASYASSVGIWIQSATNTRVNGGSVRNSAACYWITDSSNCYVGVSCL